MLNLLLEGRREKKESRNETTRPTCFKDKTYKQLKLLEIIFMILNANRRYEDY